MNSRNYKNSKKGQIEMFGLAIIIVLISLGFFIFVSFKANEEVKNPKKEFIYDKTADDFILSILHVSVQECSQFTVADLIVDCARDHRLKCASSTVNSCEALNKSVTTMLNRTFMVHDTKFRFYSDGLKYINSNEEMVELFEVSYNGCTAASNQGRSGRAVIKETYPAPTVFLYLNLCY